MEKITFRRCTASTCCVPWRAKGELPCYHVFCGDTFIGKVQQRARESWRSDNTGSRIRWGFRGYSYYWRAADSESLLSRDFVARTRAEAVAAMVKGINL